MQVLDDFIFFFFKAWKPRIAKLYKDFHNAKKGKRKKNRVQDKSLRFFDKSSEVNENLGVSPSLSVGGRAIRHSLHSAIATLRSNNTYYPLRKGRTIARQKNEQSPDLLKNQIR